MPAPVALAELVARFREQLPDYKRGRYTETQLRRDYLDPLFRLLGWDVDNSAGYAESFREVVHEDSIRVGGTTKAPDYSFRIGGRRLFFLEAKKPAVVIRDEVPPAYQLRRYAWSAGLKLSILSDFEEFAVYDGSIKPTPRDKPAKARVFYCTFEEYAEKWDFIAGLFSKEAVLRGGIDRFVGRLPGRRGTAAVDADFLAQIEAWRELLARNIALRNAGLDAHALNHAVQATIDRIVFLRICEDRGIEPEHRLLGLTNGPGIYARLVQVFRDADDRYNSGLFHFRTEKGRPGLPDEYTLGLVIDDKPLREIIRALYYPESPYEFSVLPADLLGQVYERFLGKVIRLTSGGLAKVEDKPEVKKAGGVYYTPTYIVEYIVQRTVGRLLEGKTPKQAERLRICDPACGSGSFLIGAYQYLLDWHLKWYCEHDPERHARGRAARLRPAPDGWRLTVAEKKRILLANLYGVDIDPQAVEVTKLSLLLKVLEGETGDTLGLKQLKLFHERALPDLDANIQCGNALIGTDFYAAHAELDEAARRRVNAFDWATGFKEVFKSGGFDAVIGNPPYIRIQTLKEWAPLEVEYYKGAYRAASKGNYDLYAVFVERGLELLKAQGRLGFILPHKFFNAEYGQPLRALIAAGRHLAEVVHFGHQQVFAGATTYTCLLFMDKAGAKECRIERVDDLTAWRAAPTAEAVTTLPAAAITAAPWNFVSGTQGALFERLMAMPVKLGQVAHIFVGTQTSADDVFVLEDCKREGDLVSGYSYASGKIVSIEASCTLPFLRGKEIRRYQKPVSASVLICPYHISDDKLRLISESELAGQCPMTLSYLRSHKMKLQNREDGRFKGENWYAYGYPKSMNLFDKPKLIVPDYNNRPSFTLDLGGYFFKTGYGIILKNEQPSRLFVLGLLNSKLLFQCLRVIGTELRGGYVRFWTKYIQQLPIRLIDFADPADRARHDKMVELVEAMLGLHERLATARTAHDKTLIRRQIEATDRQIEAMVYALYGLSDAEIRLVEGEAT